jgi:hypothetical protein
MIIVIQSNELITYIKSSMITIGTVVHMIAKKKKKKNNSKVQRKSRWIITLSTAQRQLLIACAALDTACTPNSAS